jgi:hypothetical protein
MFDLIAGAIDRKRCFGPTVIICSHELRGGDPRFGHSTMIGAVLAVLLAIVVSACVFYAVWWLIGKL